MKKKIDIETLKKQKDNEVENKKRISGITLIALVVTIIVIIILATVGITVAIGNGGILEKTDSSKVIVKLSEYESTIKMVTASEYTKKMESGKAGKLKALVKETLKLEEDWVSNVEDVEEDENKIKVTTVEDYIIIAQIWDDGELDIVNSGINDEEPYPQIKIEQIASEEAGNNKVKLKVTATIEITDKTKSVDTITFINTGEVIQYETGKELIFEVDKTNKYTFEAVSNMGKASRQSVRVKIVSTEADIQIASAPTTPRNTLKTVTQNGVETGPIEVSIDYGYTDLQKQYKVGTSGTWVTVDAQNVKVKVTDNTTVYARYYDGESKEVKLTSYSVENVDNIAPDEFYITATGTKDSITVNASTIDTASKGADSTIAGVKEYAYRIYKNEAWGEWQASKEFTNLPEGEYKVQAKAIDKAGNETVSTNTLTIECILPRVNVTFDNNDGSDNKQTVLRIVGEELGTLPEVSRAGYDFDGWYTDKTEGTKINETTEVPENDVTYYARWNEVLITLNPTSYIYDGTEKKPEITVEAGGVTLVKDTDYTVSYKNNINVGTATVTVTGKGSHEGVIATANFTITKATLTVPAQSGTLTYSGSAQSPSWNSNYNSSLMTLGGATSGTNAGSYNATFTLKDTVNYQWSDKTTAAKTVAWKIGQANGYVTLDANKSITYGTASTTFAVKTNHGGTLSVSDDNSTAGSSVSGTTVTVSSLGTLSAGTKVKVTVTCAATTNYKVAKETFTLTIAKATPTITLSATSAASVNYNATGTFTATPSVAGTWSVTSGNTTYVTVSTSTTTAAVNTAMTVTYKGAQATGTAVNITVKLTPTDTTNYNEKSATFKVTKVNKITNTLTVTAKSLTYSGSAQTLVTTSKAQGTVYYAVGTELTSSNYTSAGSATIPKETNAGTYTVYYYTPGNTNYNAKSGKVSVTIAKAAATNPTLSDTTVAYDTKAHAIGVSGGSGGTIYYRTSTDNSTWGNWTTTKPTRTEVGTTYVQAYVKGNSNHNNTSATASKKITIQTSYWKNTTKGTYYTSTANAVSAASSGDTIQLLRNYTDSGTVSIGKTLTIDLQTYTWTKTSSTISVTSAGKVSVGGSGGKITTSGAFHLITNAGTFTLSGTSSLTSTETGHYVVNNSGTYTQSSANAKIETTGYGIYNGGGTVTIGSGTINANYHAIKNSRGTLNINGGTITGNKGNKVTASAVYNGGTMTVKGGTVQGANHQAISNDGTCKVTGGTVKTTKASNAISNQSTGKVTVSAGTVSTTVAYAIYSVSTESTAVVVSGGTVTSSTTSGTIYNNGKGTVTLSGGTIKNTNTATGATNPVVKNGSTGKIAISGATIQKANNGTAVYNQSTGTVSMSSGTITFTQKGNKGIYSSSTGAITITGGKITNVVYGIESSGNVIMRSGEISASGIGIYLHGGSSTNVTVGQGSGGAVYSPSVYSSGNGISCTSSAAVKCYSGIISSKNMVISTTGNIIFGYATEKQDSIPVIFKLGDCSSTAPVAKGKRVYYYCGIVGSESYSSFAMYAPWGPNGFPYFFAHDDNTIDPNMSSSKPVAYGGGDKRLYYNVGTMDTYNRLKYTS